MKAKSLKHDKESDKLSEKGFMYDAAADQIIFPFPEWSDQDIRAENWKGPATFQPPQKAESSTFKSRGHEVTATVPTVNESYHFEDEQQVCLPYSLVAYEWKTASQVFPDSRLEVYVNTVEYPDLTSGSKHLLHSEFMRNFISSIHMLTYLGNTTQFDIEYVSPNFAPTTSGRPWRPWHHIYSNSFAGMKHAHEPTFNKSGKYVVRLFWMGTWRKVYVDDKLPVDMLNHVMLPSIYKEKPPKEEEDVLKSAGSSRVRISLPKIIETEIPEEKVTELWPFLLSKALMKVASLTWYEGREIVDFDIVQCLTGWHPLKINTKEFSIFDIWKTCWGYTNHYKWPPEELHRSSKSDRSFERLSNRPKSEKKGKKGILPLEVPNEDVKYCHVVARCIDLRNYTDANEPYNIFPCWSHEFLIDQTRNIPLLRPTLTADLQLWKRLRWLPWAVEKGMVPDEELLPEIRSYRLVSPFKHVFEHVFYKQPSKVDIADIASKLVPSVEPEKKDKGKGSQKEEKSSKKSQKSTGSKSSKGKKTKDEDLITAIPDPSFWADYEKVSSKINTLTVYYKPSIFKTKIEISDVNQKPQIEKKCELEWQVLVNPPTLKKSRNEPFYIFTESIDSKLIILSLAQVGFSEILYPEKVTEVAAPILVDFTECDFCMASLVKRVRRNLTNESGKDYIPVTQMEPVLVTHTRPVCYFVLEEYNWKTDTLGNTATSINTYGSKTTALKLGPGRKLFKLWIKSDTPYALQIFSDTPIAIGKIDKIITSMSQESQLLENTCIQIANCFGKLVEAFAKSEFPEKLREFYNSYKTQTYLTKAECNVVHKTFYDLLSELVEYTLDTKDMHALKVLLLKWQFPLRIHYPEECNLCNCYDEEDLEYLKATERYVTKIQALFRGIYERSYMKRHSMSHREYKTINENLMNIYSAIFSVQSRLEVCPNLIRAFLAHPGMKEIKERYEIFQDLENVLTVKEVESTVKIAENQWTLICRQQFYVNSKDSIPIKINLSCNLEDYVVRVVDNNTMKEIKRYTNNVGVREYRSNTRGYCTLCYVWSVAPQILNYKLSFATKKEVECEKVVLSTVSSETNLFSGMYIPNVNNIICKHLINVRCQRALLSVHFACSFSDALIRLRLYDDKDKVVQEVVGTGEVVLPAVYIANKNKPFYDPTTLKDSITDKGRRTTVKSKVPEKSRQSIEDKKLSIKTGESQSAPISTIPSASAPPPASLRLRRSLEHLQEQHVRPYYHGPETKDYKKNLRVDKTITYRIEVSLLDDSWPLNGEEWKNVERYFDSAGLHRSSSQSSVLSKMSVMSMRKSRKLRSTVRVASASKPQKPYWIMEVVQQQDENIDITKDLRRFIEMMAIKDIWCGYDASKPKRAHELRKQFLEINEYPNPNIPEDLTTRSLERTTFAPTLVPPLDLQKYMIKDPYEVKEKRYKNNIALEKDAERELAAIEEAEMKRQENVEKINKFVEVQMENVNLFTKWFNDIRQESHQMMAHAMKLRTAYINETLEAQRVEMEKKENEAKVKKGKKDKKG